MPVFHRFSILLLFMLPVLHGCNQPGRLDGLIPVRGTVLYNGQPAEGAEVTFLPSTDENSAAAEAKQRPASGLTDAAGKFSLATLRPNDGAYPGKYVVLVTKKRPEKTYTRDELIDAHKKGIALPGTETENHLPATYASKETTPFSLTLDAKGNVDLKLELRD